METACPRMLCGGIGRTGDNQNAPSRVQSMQQFLSDFGKHKAEHINQVDDGHLEWIVDTFSKSHPWWKAAAHALTRRVQMKRQQPTHVHDLLSDLKFCTKKRDLQKGRQIHTNAVEKGIHSNMYVAAALINMYVKCGSMVDASTVFDSLQEPNVVSWTALILGYAGNGQGPVALDLFMRMKNECRCAPDSVTYVAALKACTSLAANGHETGKKECLERGREIHLEIGCHMNHFVQNTLIDMYAKCGSMEDARTVFDSIQEPNVVSWNALVLGYADNGQALVALNLFSRMKDGRKCTPDSVTYIAVLKACTSLAADGDDTERKHCLDRGRKIHSEIGCHMNSFVQNTLLDMYAKCGSIVDARAVFDSIQEPDLVSWNALIRGYADNGQGLVALDLFSRMKDHSSCAPNSVTYVAALKACTSLAVDEDESGKKRCLERGIEIHSTIGCHMNRFLQNMLIDLYAKCGSMVAARTVFDGIQEPDVLSWTTLMLGYADNGQGLGALNLFWRMKDQRRCLPDSVAYVAVLKACASLAAESDETGRKQCLKWGREIHSEIGCHAYHFVRNTLIDMYGKCGSMGDAKAVFDGIQEPDVVSWNALILGYADGGQGLVALKLFSRMKDECRCGPNSVTYVAVLKACMSLLADGNEWCLEQVSEIHSEIGCHMNRFVQSTLIHLYVNCGRMEHAKTVFDSIQKPDVVSWNALMLGYAENGQGRLALDLFWRMKNEGRCAPNSVTYVAALKACTSMAAYEAGKEGCLERARQIHMEIGCHMNHFVQNTLIDIYSKCGSMEDSRAVFDGIQNPDVVSWTALLLGYADNGQGFVALDLFSRMKGESRCTADSVTYVAALKACTSMLSNGDETGKKWCLELGKEIHMQIGGHMNHFVQNTLVSMYTKCGSMVDARKVFDAIQEPDVVSWNALILGYAESGHGLVALDLLSRMKDDCRCAPDSVTYVAALKACSSVGAFAIGQRFHSEITVFNAHLVTSLIDFYGKCGNMEEAREVFGLHPRARDVSTWTSLLAGYGRFGDTGSVVSLFEAMQDQGFQPNAVTFVCMLTCCSHAGLVEKAWEYLELMPTRYRVTPTVMHYNCMVDLLGRANKLNEAVALIQTMPCDPNVVTWTTLLGACRKWKNVEIGRLAFKSLVHSDEKNGSAYILMAEIYGSRRMWEEQQRVLERRMKSGAP